MCHPFYSFKQELVDPSFVMLEGVTRHSERLVFGGKRACIWREILGANLQHLLFLKFAQIIMRMEMEGSGFRSLGQSVLLLYALSASIGLSDSSLCIIGL